MFTRGLLPALLVACGAGTLPSADPGPATVEVRVVDKQVAAGEPIVVQVEVGQAEGWQVPPVPVGAEGLEPGPVQTSDARAVGARTVVVQQVELSGPDGSYVLDPPPITATGPGGESREIDPPALFVDIGVQGPTSQLADFEAPPPPSAPPWVWIAGGAGAAALLALGVWAWRRRPQPAAPPEPLTPSQQARRDWDAALAARGAGSLDDQGLAVELSSVFRRYLEAILAFPATARTTREIVAWLDHNGLLVGDVRAPARRLLDATDRLKFAREGGGEAFFAALSSDFHAVLQATRPRAAAPAGREPERPGSAAPEAAAPEAVPPQPGEPEREAPDA